MGLFVATGKSRKSLRYTPRSMRSGLRQPDLEMQSVFGNATTAQIVEKMRQDQLLLSGNEGAEQSARYALTHRTDVADWQPEPEGIPKTRDLWREEGNDLIVAELLTMSEQERCGVQRSQNASRRGPRDANAPGQSLESEPQTAARWVWLMLGLDQPEWSSSKGRRRFDFE